MAKKDNFGRVPQNYKGTRDYDGLDAKLRNYVIDQIRYTFELFGFEPLETPAIELDRILSGKYGEEGEQKRFKVNASGPANSDDRAGLRYDHTVPLARYMAMNPTTNILPYRRYAIGKVWRHESVQAGRYREFTQCDFDTVGSSSLVVDAEIMAINYTILSRLGFPDVFRFEFNDRRLLDAMARRIGATENQAIEIFRAWDKLEKVGLDGAVDELTTKKLSKQLVTNFREFTYILSQSADPLSYLRQALSPEDLWTADLVSNLYFYAQSLGVPTNNILFNPLLARGLDYYTGPIMETVVRESGIGSITGGGRFDNLIALMGGPSLPASGSSFGLERVIGVMTQLGIRAPIMNTSPVYVTLFDQSNLDLVNASFRAASILRLDGVACEVYTGDQVKLGKQIDIANRKGARLVIIIGGDELANGIVTIKNLSTRQQYSASLADLSTTVSQLLS